MPRPVRCLASDLMRPDVLWQVPDVHPALVAGEVHVWRFRLDAAGQASTWSPDSLSPDEAARARTFALREQGLRFAYGRVAQRRILARYLGCLPKEVAYRSSAYGKPELVGSASKLRFNASNSGVLGLVAVTSGVDVGVDVECVRPLPDWRLIASQVLGDAELRRLYDVMEPQRLAAFFHVWTRKEAVAKCTGLGLSLCWRTVDVTFANARLSPIDGDGGLPVGADSWWLHDLDPGENYVGAVAVHCSNAMRVRCLDAPLPSDDG
jgi:4'-phosphopantetheinyl transferase